MFILNRNDTAPLYKQLYNQIREHALSGKLPANSKLPSVRDLAAELSTSRNTVEGACLELHAEGYYLSFNSLRASAKSQHFSPIWRSAEDQPEPFLRNA